MTVLVMAAAAFFLLHRLVSAGPLRAPLVRRLGEPLFQRLFGGVSLACLLWLALGYWLASAAQGSPRWVLGTPAWLIWAIGSLGIVLIVCGATVRNPATAGMTDAVSDPQVDRGVLRITRHPFLWGVAAVSTAHILGRPDDPTLVFFGTLGMLALIGTSSIDSKRRKRLGSAWTAFADRTSNVPFVAILRRRQSLRLREIGWRPVGVSLVLIAIIVIGHALGGGSPLTGAN